MAKLFASAGKPVKSLQTASRPTRFNACVQAASTSIGMESNKSDNQQLQQRQRYQHHQHHGLTFFQNNARSRESRKRERENRLFCRLLGPAHTNSRLAHSRRHHQPASQHAHLLAFAAGRSTKKVVTWRPLRRPLCLSKQQNVPRFYKNRMGARNGYHSQESNYSEYRTSACFGGTRLLLRVSRVVTLAPTTDVGACVSTTTNKSKKKQETAVCKPHQGGDNGAPSHHIYQQKERQLIETYYVQQEGSSYNHHRGSLKRERIRKI